MDPISQGLFGAVVGQAGFSRSIGRRAALAGALIAMAPDIDIFWPYANELAAWVHHRGITHSLVAGPFLGAALGFVLWAFWRWRERPAPLNACLWLGVIAFTTHAGLDLFTTYGTQLLAPLTATRFAVPALPVIDIVYTLILLLATITGLFLWRRPIWVQNIAGSAIMLSIVWQFYGWHIQIDAREAGRIALAEKGILAARVEAWPLLLQPWARRIAAESETHYYLAHWSPLTGNPPEWQIYEREAHPFAAEFVNQSQFRLFYRFTSGHMFWRVYSMPNGDIRLEAHDMRYLNSMTEDMRSLWALGAQFSASGEMQTGPELVLLRGERNIGDIWRRLNAITFGAPMQN